MCQYHAIRYAHFLSLESDEPSIEEWRGATLVQERSRADVQVHNVTSGSTAESGSSMSQVAWE
jgi:hypothetical protein